MSPPSVLQGGEILMKPYVKTLEKSIEVLNVVLLVVLVLFVALQVIFRSIGFAAPWTEEMARFAFVYITFFGSVLVLKEGGHIVIDFVISRFPVKIKRVMDIIINLSVAAFLILIISGGKSTLQVNKVVTAASLSWFKMNYVYGGVLVASLLMLAYTIAHIYVLALGDYEKDDTSGQGVNKNA